MIWIHTGSTTRTPRKKKDKASPSTANRTVSYLNSVKNWIKNALSMECFKLDTMSNLQINLPTILPVKPLTSLSQTPVLNISSAPGFTTVIFYSWFFLKFPKNSLGLSCISSSKCTAFCFLSELFFLSLNKWPFICMKKIIIDKLVNKHELKFLDFGKIHIIYFMQSTPQQQPTQMQHTQSTLPPMPSLVNNMHPQQQQQPLLPPPTQSQSLPIKANSSLPPQPSSQNMVQNPTALNNNDVSQSFSNQSLNPNLNLGGMLGRHFCTLKKIWISFLKCW